MFSWTSALSDRKVPNDDDHVGDGDADIDDNDGDWRGQTLDHCCT